MVDLTKVKWRWQMRMAALESKAEELSTEKDMLI